MKETLSFPGLGLEFDIDRVAVNIPIGNGIVIYWYGVIIAAAFLAGVIYVMKRVKEFGLDGDRVIDVILGGVVLGLIGARLYYVLFKWDEYRGDLAAIINIRQGGVAIYGGIIGALIAGILVCKWRKVKLFPLLDLVVGGLLLGQAIGRWGNFVNIEAFGSNTSMPWGMTSSSIAAYLNRESANLASLGVAVDPTQPVHPTFFYESLWCLLGFLFVAWFTKRRLFDGQLSLIYLGWYGLGRFFIEGLRTDSLLLGSLRISQIVALLCVLGSVIALVTVHSKVKRANDPDYLPLYVNTEEGQSVLAGTFYPKKKGQAEKDEEGFEEASGVEEGQPSKEAPVNEEAEGPDERLPGQTEERAEEHSGKSDTADKETENEEEVE